MASSRSNARTSYLLAWLCKHYLVAGFGLQSRILLSHERMMLVGAVDAATYRAAQMHEALCRSNSLVSQPQEDILGCVSQMKPRSFCCRRQLARRIADGVHGCNFPASHKVRPAAAVAGAMDDDMDIAHVCFIRGYSGCSSQQDLRLKSHGWAFPLPRAQ